jgi:hypothetical protein
MYSDRADYLWGDYDFTGGFAKVRQDDKWGFVNTSGEAVVPCIYDNAWGFSEGLAVVGKNYKHGFINMKGEEVVPCVYDVVYEFSDGLACVQKVDTETDKWSIINTKGRVIVAECTRFTEWSRVEME